MNSLSLTLTTWILLTGCVYTEGPDLDVFPSTTIGNDEVTMKVYLPDAEKGLYRATRFDWSGMIGSLQYRGHEYFGYWKKTHDPYFHEDLTGPVEGFIEPGLGYEEATPGQGFIRIGVGLLEKQDEQEYQWKKTYPVLDYGRWDLEQGKDWISFTHTISSELGYGYAYTKTIRLKEDGFMILHRLKNTGEKPIETDQFNHNFFMMDGERSGTAFEVNFPFEATTESDLKGLVELEGNSLRFIKDLQDTSVFMDLKGFGESMDDHRVRVTNHRSGAGVEFTVNKPLYRMVFWACETTLCPENFIWISIPPGQEEEWISDYTLKAGAGNI
jgi:hypothetical protein